MALKTKEQPSMAGHRGTDNDKRQAIIEAARELFTSAGYETTTIAQVARRAGVAVGTVYLYFKNKSDLLVAVKGDWETEVLQAMMRPDLNSIPYHLRARPILEACFEICARHTEVVQLMGLQAAELVGEWKSQPTPPLSAALKSFMDEALAAGVIRPVDPESAAVLLYSMVNGTLLQCFVVEGGRRQDVYLEALVDAIEHYLIKSEYLGKRSN
jgi:AcrR family transcriptional regulator